MRAIGPGQRSALFEVQWRTKVLGMYSQTSSYFARQWHSSLQTTVPTQPARNALLLAERYLEWCTNDRNKQIGLQFAQELFAGLEHCFLSQTSMKVRRERMWESYYKFRSSVDFSLKWIDHLSPIGGSRSDPCPIFYIPVRH